MKKDKIVQITGSGNFQLYKSGSVAPIPLCPNTTNGEHVFAWIRDSIDIENSTMSITKSEYDVIHIYKYRCEECGMVDTTKGSRKVEKHKIDHMDNFEFD